MHALLADFLTFGHWLDLLEAHVLTIHFWVNVLDILIIWFLMYKAIMFLRGTKAIQLVKGIALILLIRIVSGWIGLNTISWLMDQVITYGVIALIVIFQPEIRRALEHLGRGTIFKKRSSNQERNDVTRVIQAYDKAIQYMSKRRIGALIAIERETGLEEYIETGIPIGAEITGELLINIFIPNTPLHDGAVIVKNNKVAVACAYLPLSESMAIPKEFGTRHRAAVGLSEVSDAITIVVSEETGEVSLTMNGELMSHLSRDDYMRILEEALMPEKQQRSTRLWQSLFTRKGGH